jgi:hypothetical protein
MLKEVVTTCETPAQHLHVESSANYSREELQEELHGSTLHPCKRNYTLHPFKGNFMVAHYIPSRGNTHYIPSRGTSW